jgi:multidrug resistance efflux pump
MMAEAEGSKFQRKTIRTFYGLLLIAGIAVYWIWGILYNTWNPFTRDDIAIYPVFITLIAFGIIGLLLYRKKPNE